MENGMQLFWKYFFQGFGHYFNSDKATTAFQNNIQADCSKVTNDFTKIYNKIIETKK